MRLGIALDEMDPWGFFDEIYIDLKNHYQTTVFKKRVFQLPVFNTRINRHLFNRDLKTFLKANDVVFFEWASRLLVEASRLPKTCGIVTRLHRYELYEWADQINWDNVDKIILVSQTKEQEFIKKFPAHAAKTVVSSPSTSLDKFQPVSKPFKGDIGILCHLTPRKRVYDLILTFYELLQQKDDFYLHIAGGTHSAHKDYYDSLLAIVEDLNLQDKVTFYGNITAPWTWYGNIDIFISNSYSEGLQVAPMEAMACGRYCLSHRWRGAEELLPQENLFYTSRQLQTKILHYANLPEAEKQNQATLMRTIATTNFDIKKTSAQIIQIIEDTQADFKAKHRS